MVNAPLDGSEIEEKQRFWSKLGEVGESIPWEDRVVIGADFNGNVGEGNRGDEEVMDRFGILGQEYFQAPPWNQG